MKTNRIRIWQLLGCILIHSILLQAAEPTLKFTPDGTFKILVFADTHLGPQGDSLTARLLERVIDIEKPNFILVNGDVTTGDPGPSVTDLQKAIAQLGNLLAAKKIPWAITFGNHDCESLHKYGISKADHMSFYESYPYNMNSGWERGLSGVGDKNILILDAKGQKPVFGIWLIDSQSASSIPGAVYEWIKTDQVYWYYKKSKELEAQWGKKIPSLMFFHIPLPEIKEMVMTTKTIGTRHEPECPSNINSGMFAAVLDRGDVLGIFHGHDHLNNYVGKWKGIMMGYVSVAGFRPYPYFPKDDIGQSHIRGGRVFLLNENDPNHFQTWIRFNDGHRSWESEDYIKYIFK